MSANRTIFRSHWWVEWDDTAGATTVVDICHAVRNPAGGAQQLAQGDLSRVQYLALAKDPIGAVAIAAPLPGQMLQYNGPTIIA